MRAFDMEREARSLDVQRFLRASGVNRDLEMSLPNVDIKYVIVQPDYIIIAANNHAAVMDCMKRLAGDTSQKWTRGFEYGQIVYDNKYRQDMKIQIKLMGVHPVCKTVMRKVIVPATPAVEAVPEHIEEQAVLVCGEVETEAVPA